MLVFITSACRCRSAHAVVVATNKVPALLGCACPAPPLRAIVNVRTSSTTRPGRFANRGRHRDTLPTVQSKCAPPRQHQSRAHSQPKLLMSGDSASADTRDPLRGLAPHEQAASFFMCQFSYTHPGWEFRNTPGAALMARHLAALDAPSPARKRVRTRWAFVRSPARAGSRSAQSAEPPVSSTALPPESIADPDNPGSAIACSTDKRPGEKSRSDARSCACPAHCSHDV